MNQKEEAETRKQQFKGFQVGAASLTSHFLACSLTELQD